MHPPKQDEHGFLPVTADPPYALPSAGKYGGTLTWATMKPRPPIRAVWSGIGHYVGFSRWIWASSVINLLLNQFDKVVVGKLLGPAQLGGYQMSSRLAQMLREEPSGNIFGLTQNAGMGWNPAEVPAHFRRGIARGALAGLTDGVPWHRATKASGCCCQ